MFDDDDFNNLAWGLDGLGGGVIATIFVIAILLFAGYELNENHETCAEVTCPSGRSAELLHHDCMCVTPAE